MAEESYIVFGWVVERNPEVVDAVVQVGVSVPLTRLQELLLSPQL
jgi:hypothetical protein